ncbi:MAG TPA: transglycosylase SLT domain-containing protein [Syntrophorhabdales bacterium]|nr:transglycosylase SLT domain-containing protein [Syntrophorhabdales bacterium]
MYWLNLLRIILVVVGFSIPVACPAWAQEEFGGPADGITAEQEDDSWAGDRQETGFDIREDIRKARELLASKRCGYTVTIERTTVLVKGKRGRTRVKVVKKRIIEPAFLLAVENLRERTLRLVRFTSRGCETKGFDVIKTRANGVASRFEVRHPENMAVLALRTMVHGEEKGYEEVVYTPYSPTIDTRLVREDGLNYLRARIESARADLEEKNVPLKGLECISGDVAPTEISLVLSIIEHIDPLRFKNCPPGGETVLVHEVLTIIGANMSDAYAYSRSPAGARGLFQFIPGTYEKILRKYREAGLDRNFVSGCSNPTNAAKASLLLFDSDLNDLPEDYLRAMGSNVQAVGQYIAAAYNCGSRRVERSLRACDDGWTCLLPEETKTYLRKFDAVWRMRESLDK